MSWKTREGVKTPNYYGSMTQSATIYLGEYNNAPVYVPFNKVVPMTDPNKIVVSGWDINAMDMYNAMKRAHVLAPELVDKLRPLMESIKPLPSVYYKDFIASN
jgi:myo-inositol-1-phosphate synthase